VRLFVFHHECGHHHVGGNELSADCWAVDKGVREGWLDKPGLGAVCKSFGDAPATPTHPSGARRCRNIDRCFATTTAAIARAQPSQMAAAERPAAAPTTKTAGDVIPASTRGPRLLSGPTLVRNGYGR
jgi:hypothetical protein